MNDSQKRLLEIQKRGSRVIKCHFQCKANKDGHCMRDIIEIDKLGKCSRIEASKDLLRLF